MYMESVLYYKFLYHRNALFYNIYSLNCFLRVLQLHVILCVCVFLTNLKNSFPRVKKENAMKI